MFRNRRVRRGAARGCAAGRAFGRWGGRACLGGKKHHTGGLPLSLGVSPSLCRLHEDWQKGVRAAAGRRRRRRTCVALPRSRRAAPAFSASRAGEICVAEARMAPAPRHSGPFLQPRLAAVPANTTLAVNDERSARVCESSLTPYSPGPVRQTTGGPFTCPRRRSAHGGRSAVIRRAAACAASLALTACLTERASAPTHARTGHATAATRDALQALTSAQVFRK